MKLEVEELNVYIGERPVLIDVSLELREGLHVVLGPNGAGKSTLLKSIACIIRPSKGRILLNGEDLCSKNRKEIARLVGYCWQNPLYGFFESTVEREINFIVRNLGVRPRREVIDLLGIKGLMNRSPFELSGGEAKRVSLASILIADQPVVLLDEPFEELDWKGTLSVSKLIDLFREEGKIVMIAVNNPFIVTGLRPDTYMILRSGRIVARGRWEDLSDEILEENCVVPRRYLCRYC